ncbi:MAG: DUF4333 domain-containing protein [Pseudonocardia sp.]
MSTPQGPPHPDGGSSDQPSDPPAWGQQPPGGWGQPPPWEADPARALPPDAAPGWGGHQAGQQPGWGQPGYGDPAQYGPPQQYGQPPFGEQQYGGPGYSGPQYPDQQQAWGHPAQHGWGQYATGQQPPQQWGPGYPPLPEPTVRSRRSPTPTLRGVAAAAVVVIVVLLLGFVTPGFFVTRIFDAEAMQQGVQQVLVDDYGLSNVTSVSCGQNIRVDEGAAFACDAIVDGEPMTVPIRVTSGDGDYEVGRPI